MKDRLIDNLIDSFFSVIPISIIIFIIGLLIGISTNIIISFLVSSMFLVIGMTLFTTGADMSMITIGENIGESLIKKGKKWLVLLVSFIIGVVITIAEPDLMVLAKQLTSIPDIIIILSVALGVGLFLLIAVWRIFKKLPFKQIVIVSWFIILGLLALTPKEFVPVAFDSGGVTTGPMGVPLIVALGYGLTKFRSDKNAKEDSFGLCGLSSLGPIIIVLLLGLFFKTDSAYNVNNFIKEIPFIENFVYNFLANFKEVIIALIPIVVIFVIMELFNKERSKLTIIKVGVGLILTVLGLTLFLTGVSAGFLKMGYFIGNIMGNNAYNYLLIPIGMLFGYILVNAEPGIKMLNMQISDLTEGSISPKVINNCLSIGVCVAIGLALLRVIYQIPISYFLVPGYFITCLLTYFSPKVFTAIAFDAGGAASGPLTTSFLLPLCIGLCVAFDGNIMTDAFGVGALVSMTPLITIQTLGIIYQYKLNKQDARNEFDESLVEYSWES